MNARKFFNALLWTTLIIMPTRIFAQAVPADPILQKMVLNRQNQPAALFVHFDKNVYTATEMAWFTGYLLKTTPNAEPAKVLSVALINGSNRKVIAQKQFLMESNLAFGNLRLPDSLPAGRYTFIAYTDVMRKDRPDQFFTQPITVKTLTDPPFSASLKLVDSTGADGYYKVLLEGFTKSRSLLTGAKVTWYPATGPIEEKTDARGEFLFKIPVAGVDAKHTLFETDITSGKETRRLKLRLPLKHPRPQVSFFPEGGYMVSGMQGFVAWEALTAEGAPLLTSAILLKNGQPADTLQTNSYGTGKFIVSPEHGSVYTLKVGDERFDLPAPLLQGPVITIRNAVANDTLNVSLRGQTPGRFTILIHDYRSVYLNASVELQGQAMTIRVPLTDVPRGLKTFTLLDAADRPYAERMIFAHYDRKDNLLLSTDSSEVHKRGKVTVSLDLRSADGTPTSGLISVACVQENRLEVKNRTDIENFFYLQNELGSLPQDPLAAGIRNKGYLEDMLMVKGWSRYSWQKLEQETIGDTPHPAALTFSGLATKDDKPLKKPVAISIIRLPLFSTVSTDSTGRFSLSEQDITLAPDKKTMISVSSKNNEDYKVKLKNPFLPVNALLAEELPDELLKDPAETPRTGTDLISRSERSILLDVVQIGTKKDAFAARKNACGDYVCPANILNCPNPMHYNDPRNIAPVTGGRYIDPQTRQLTVYKGCDESNLRVLNIEGIYLAKEFYGADYAAFNPEEPEYISTVLWKHGILLKEDGKASFSFYMSDIAGNFKIIAQGITRNGVVYGEKTIVVSSSR